MHLSALPMIYYGEVKHFVFSFVMYFLTGCFGMSITFHRLISHKSFECNKFFRVLGLLLGTIGLTGSALAWCAVHREHHYSSDTPNDPHSPLHKNYFWVEFASMFHKPRIKFLKPFLKDPTLVFLHRNYFKINMAFALILFLISPFSVIYAYLFPALLLWHGGSLINLLGHIWGYRNFDTNDSSRNNVILGFLMWGEGWHNNHHKFPARANYQSRWFEFDISYLFIRFIRK